MSQTFSIACTKCKKHTGKYFRLWIDYWRYKTMWLFKRDAEFESLRQKTLKKIESFCKIGEKFLYLGVEVIVTGHEGTAIHRNGLVCMPTINANYVNKKGEIKQIQFGRGEIDILIAENKK